MDSKQEVLALLKKEIKQEVTSLLEVPPDPSLGDYALPCFTLAKTYKKAPQDIAKDLKKRYLLLFSIR